ncbi:hypothetical protein V8G54_016184 [Vigna mungo]|uniref:RING-type domain-containing protein n=1 Tax=Vigna mungo TaxID=3915 RepID=A0AAQ3NJS1_VIGMU
MTRLRKNRRFYYNVYLLGENDINDINVLMPTTLFRFTTRVFYENTSLPRGRSSALITNQTFLQDGSHSFRTLLSPLSLLRYFCTHIIEAIANVATDEIREIFQIDDVVTPLESQSSEVPLWIVINVNDTLLKKSTVLQTECCCICLDKFNLNAECYTLPCKHFFHKKCIMRWLHTSQTCPMCRQSYEP